MTPRAQPRDRQQRAHLDHVREARAQRFGQVVVEQPLRRRALPPTASSSPVVAVEQRQPALRVAERDALVVQAAVEGVVEGGDGPRGGAGAHVEVRGQQVARVRVLGQP